MDKTLRKQHVLLFLHSCTYCHTNAVLPFPYSCTRGTPAGVYILYIYIMYLFTWQGRVTVGESGICWCVYVTSFEHWLTPLCVDSVLVLWVLFCFRFCTKKDQRRTTTWVSSNHSPVNWRNPRAAFLDLQQLCRCDKLREDALNTESRTLCLCILSV